MLLLGFGGRFHQNCGCHGDIKFPVTYNGENDVPMLSFDPIFVKLAGNEDRHKISYEFEFCPDRTTPVGVKSARVSKNSIEL